MHGILIINKPPGPTSHDIVSIVRRASGQKKVGHAGTLDPAASGVLVVCLGDATRIIEYLMDWQKEYRAIAEFGVETDTEDQTGHIIREINCSHITCEIVESVLPRFFGKIQQIPPMVSAVHHGGKRLYQLARAGQLVERTPRTVEIHSLKLLDFIPDGEHPRAVLDIECSKGTYIRTLCVDIGLALNCPAHMASLIRTRVGHFTLDKSISVEEVKERGLNNLLDEVMSSIDGVLSEMPSVAVSPLDADRVRNGVILPMDSSTEPLDMPMRIHDSQGELIAIGKLCTTLEGRVVLKPEKVFAGS